VKSREENINLFESFELLLYMPEVHGFDKAKYRRNLTEVATGRFRQVMVVPARDMIEHNGRIY
jgi:hypothetical protein